MSYVVQLEESYLVLRFSVFTVKFSFLVDLNMSSELQESFVFA